MNNMGTGCEGAALTLVSVRDRIGGCPQMEGCSRVSVPGGCVPKWQRLSLLVGWISQWVCVCVVCGLPLDVPGGCVSLWEGDITGCPQFLCPWWVSRCVTPWMVVLSWVHVPGWGWIFPVSVPCGCPGWFPGFCHLVVPSVQGRQCRRLVSPRLRSRLPQPEPCQLPVPPSDQLCRPHGHLPPRGEDIRGHGGGHGNAVTLGHDMTWWI